MGAAFFVQGFTFVALTAKLPAIQDELHLSPSDFFVLMLALVPLPALMAFASFLTHVVPEVVTAEVAVPWRRILTLGLALALFYMVDTAVTTWAPTYLHRTFDASSRPVAVATLPFPVGSLVSRACGDALTARLGPAALVGAAGGFGAVGLGLVVFAGSPSRCSVRC